MARRFLWLVAILVGLVLLAALVWRLAGDRLLRGALVPSDSFAESPLPPAPDPARDDAWVARPGMDPNPAQWTPAGFRPAPRPAAVAFHVPPTAFISKRQWNAPLDDRETNDRLASFTRVQASVFNGVADLWVPRYRQATFGAFLRPGPDADQALAVAEADVMRAFDAFLAAVPADAPIILSGHSQGARHLLRLLAGLDPAVRRRIVAAYVVGWPVVADADVAAAGLPACTAREQAGCIASWQSFAADADLAAVRGSMAPAAALDGAPVGARALVCLNPLTGGREPGDAAANAGTLIREALVPQRTGARCEEGGLLLIDPPPRDIGPYVLPNGNYHAYDFQLFWANVRSDVEARLSAHAARAGAG